MKPDVTIHTDGSCKDQRGGWAALLEHNGAFHMVTGSEKRQTTNQQMELRAVVEALRQLKVPCSVQLVSDSMYIVDGLGRVDTWAQSNWVGSQRKPIANRDLWQELHALSHQHDITPTWVKGHATSATNKLVDWFAQAASSPVHSAS